jgi:uncharacterized protein YaaQ
MASTDTNLVIALTEQDLDQLVSMLKETTQNQEQGNVQVDTSKIFHNRQTPSELMHLVLDVITLS